MKFRSEAIDGQSRNEFGEIVLVRPVSFSVMVGFAIFILLVLVVFLLIGGYAKKNTVSGELVPDRGTIKIRAAQAGVLIKKSFVDNQVVKKGDVLFTFRNTVYNESSEDSKIILAKEMNDSIGKINNEIKNITDSNYKNIGIYKGKLVNIEKEIMYIRQQIDTQKSRLDLSEKIESKYKKLLSSGLITEDQFFQKKIDFYNQTEEIKVLLQKVYTLKNQALDITKTIGDSENNTVISISKLERELSEKNKEILRFSSERDFAITSPIDGVVSSTLVNEGQALDTGQILTNIVPLNSVLRARLLVPSKAIGFIARNNPVSLRYQAFPYQQFGQHRGIVESISTTPIMIKDTTFNYVASGKNEEAMYIVNVVLDNQFIKVRGETRPLMAGMIIEADIKYAKLPLYMWMFEPLLSLSKI